MGLLSIFKKKDASAEPQKPAAPQKSADVAVKTESTKKEVKPVADKITLGYTHLSGCTGCTVALADNYAGLLTLLDKYVDLKYMPTLADARHVQKVDVSFIEGSVCINDKLAVEELKETREKSAVVVALGGCACYGNITRFSRGGQQNQPAHEAYLPDRRPDQGGRVHPRMRTDPADDQERCGHGIPAPQGNQGTEGPRNCIPQAPHDGRQRATSACFCDLMTKVINQGLCMGCGSCASACPVNAITHGVRQAPGRARPVHQVRSLLQPVPAELVQL